MNLSIVNKLFYYFRLFTLLSISLIFSGKLFSATNELQYINQINVSYNNDQPLRIAVASNFTPALKKLLIDFHQRTNINTQIISGATGAMFIQIQHGAPFDIFLAADSLRPLQLEQKDLVIANSRKTYAQGQLALFSESSTAQLHDLNKGLNNTERRLAIANPDIAPYGKAAKQTLEYLGLWEQYKHKIVVGININQTFAQVRTKAVNNGLVANSQLILNNLTGTIIPSNYYQPIKQQLVILKSSQNINKAKILSEYLLSSSVQKEIVSFGYAELE
jgi:molybdate transport system substrate-binding protein